MKKLSNKEHSHADECGCKLAEYCLIAALSWAVGKHIWGAADLWTVNNLWLVLGATMTGKLVGIARTKLTSRTSFFQVARRSIQP